MIRELKGVAVLAAVLGVTGCAGGGLGAIGDVLGGVLGQQPGGAGAGGAQQGSVVGEVQGVDTRQNAIQIRTNDGQTGTIEFDQNTVVVYQQQQYAVTALERGDIASFQIQQVAQNRYYTSRIDVQQSVRERTGQSGGGQAGAVGQLQQVYGRVGQVDQQNGFFELQTQAGNFTVVMPANPGYSDANRFRQLRAGENISIEGTVSGTTRIDLQRFL